MNEPDAQLLGQVIDAAMTADGEGLKQWNIDRYDKGGQWLLRYNPEGRNPHACICRGLILEKGSGAIVSFPFTRFFNRHEPEASPVDLTNADMLEKLDGTMVAVFMTGSEVQWQTNRMTSMSKKDMEITVTSFHGQKFKLMQLIGEHVLNLKEFRSDLTMIFEFIHEASFVVTRYDPSQYGLYLIGARKMRAPLDELSEAELDAVAGSIGVRRPRRWDALSEETVQTVMADCCAETAGFEGFIFRDRTTGTRVKLKNEDYLKLHHQIDELSYKRLVVKMYEGEGQEISSYFAVAKTRIAAIKRARDAFVRKVIGRMEFWRDQNLTRSELALRLLGRRPNQIDRRTRQVLPAVAAEEQDPIASLVLRFAHLRNSSDWEDALYFHLKNMAQRGQTRQYLEWIDMADQEVEDDRGTDES